MTLLAVAVGGRGVVDPDEPVLNADDEALLRGRALGVHVGVSISTTFACALLEQVLRSANLVVHQRPSMTRTRSLMSDPT